MDSERMEKVWAIVDKITTTCPMCAFGRGYLLATVVTGLLMASCHG